MLGQQINYLPVFTCVRMLHMNTFVCLSGSELQQVLRGERTHTNSCVVTCMLKSVGEKSTGLVRAFTALCCRSNRLRAAGGCATCDVSSDEKADERGIGREDTGVEVLGKWELSLFRRVDILQGTSVYSRRIHGAPLRLWFLLQVVLQYRLFSICRETHVDILQYMIGCQIDCYTNLLSCWT